ncbi:MAG: hypothetical protein II984_01705 [Clostridia bacterium]|nr:hypothetical protein [Clostridia bacterium]
MKRILSLILCVLMLVPCFALMISADEISDEYKNFAIDEGIGSYASSIWNNDSDPKYINNDVLSDSYRFWRPQGVDRNPALDDRVQYCGLKSSSQYYLLQQVEIYVDRDSADNNICYTIKALVLGEWVEIGKAYNQDAVAITGEGREEWLGKVTIDVEDVVTREIRVECSEWGRWSKANDHLTDEERWHDWWRVPIIHEVQTWGVESLPPPWDVPSGAVLSTNACLGGMANASSSNTFLNIYPALATDDKIAADTVTPRPYWQAGKRGAGQSVWTEFDRAYDIDNITANFGGSVDGITMKYDVQVLVDGVWEYVAQGLEATSSVDAQKPTTIIEFDTPKNAAGVKFIFTECNNMAILTEMGAEINSEYQIWDEERQDYVDANKCVFLRDYMTPNRKQSTAVGNLAIFGTAYASSVMTYANISSVDYINDGGIARNEDFAWFAQTFVKGTYCGVILKEAYNVDKVVLYFNDPITGDVSGTNVMEVDIQVKNANGDFETIKSGVTSYDQTKREYVVSVQFDAPVLTDDVRIVYQSNGMVFPYIKELEVYSSEFYYGAYRGYQIGQRTSGGKAANLLEDFAKKSPIPRSTYLDKISPIQYFEITKNFDIKVGAWI